MNQRLKLALFAERLTDDQRSFVALLERRTRLSIEPVAIPSYAGLYAALEARDAQVLWAPPLVALDLITWGNAHPLVAVVRGGLTSYPAVLIAREGGEVRTLSDVSGRRFAWVSKLSASGCVVPRLFLETYCRLPTRGLREQRFWHSHAEVTQAVLLGHADVGATYARLSPGSGAVTLPAGSEGLRVVAVAGFVPNEMLLAGPGVSALDRLSLADALRRASSHELSLLGPELNVERLTLRINGHLDPLQRLVEQTRQVRNVTSLGSEAISALW